MENMRKVEEAMKNHKEVQEVWKELEAARQKREHSAKKFDPVVAGN